MVSAISNAGGLGSLAMAGISTTTEMWKEIRKIKRLTDKPFAVNLTFLPVIRPISHEEMTDIVIDEGNNSWQVWRD